MTEMMQTSTAGGFPVEREEGGDVEEQEEEQGGSPTFLVSQPSEDPVDLSWNELVAAERTADGKKSGLMGASFNFINSIIGAGIIGLAFALKECGFYVGLLLLVFVAALTDYTVRLIITLGGETGKRSYEGMSSTELAFTIVFFAKLNCGL